MTTPLFLYCVCKTNMLFVVLDPFVELVVSGCNERDKKLSLLP